MSSSRKQNSRLHIIFLAPRPIAQLARDICTWAAGCLQEQNCADGKKKGMIDMNKSQPDSKEQLASRLAFELTGGGKPHSWLRSSLRSSLRFLR